MSPGDHWAGLARGLLGQYRAQAGRRAGDPLVAARTAALCDASREFREWWGRHAVADFQSTRRVFNHPRVGRLVLDYVKLAAADAPDITLFTCLPADAATAGKLPALEALGGGHRPPGGGP